MLIATRPMSWAFARRKRMRACRPWIRFACCAATHSVPAEQGGDSLEPLLYLTALMPSGSPPCVVTE